MRRNSLYILLLLLSACAGEKTLNERVSLWREDKIPYGAYYFNHQLHHIFPEATIINDNQSPVRRYSYHKSDLKLQTQLELNKKKAAEIILVPELEPDAAEWKAMMDFVGEGNQLFISSFHLGKLLLDSLDVETQLDYGYYNINDSLIVFAKNPVSEMSESFVYPGKTLDNYFSRFDSTYVQVLGTNEEGKANFIRIRYVSGGSIYLHLAPMAFSNFFLLHKENKKYFDYCLSNLPPGIKLIAWNDYFRHHRRGQEDSYNALSWVMSQPSLAKALWLLMLLLSILFIFGSKRKQRYIEERPPLRNASVDFVKTIGRLYYQRHDNRNLAAKMAAHFLDQIRTRYNLSTAQLDEAFEKKLAFKTGYDGQALHNLLYQVVHLQKMPVVSDEDLMHFSRQLDLFYKQT